MCENCTVLQLYTLLAMSAVNLCTAFFTLHVYYGHVMSGIEQLRILWHDTFFDIKLQRLNYIL